MMSYDLSFSHKLGLRQMLLSVTILSLLPTLSFSVITSINHVGEVAHVTSGEGLSTRRVATSSTLLRSADSKVELHRAAAAAGVTEATVEKVNDADELSSLLQISATHIARQAVDAMPDGHQHSAAACLPPGFTSATVNNRGKPFQMAVLAKDDIVSSSVKNSGSWEVFSVDQMADRASAKIPSSGTFLDIGANLGYYSLLFAKKGYRVISVEPSSHNRMAINASLCLNPDIAGLVKVVPVALTNEDEAKKKRCVLRSTNSKINVGNMFLNCAEGVKPCGGDEKACEDVPLKTLDSLLTELAPPSIDAVKIDIEKHECQVLAGGQSLFHTYTPKLVQVETEWSGTGCINDAAAKFSYTVRNVSNMDSAMVPNAGHVAKTSASLLELRRGF